MMDAREAESTGRSRESVLTSRTASPTERPVRRSGFPISDFRPSEDASSATTRSAQTDNAKDGPVVVDIGTRLTPCASERNLDAHSHFSIAPQPCNADPATLLYRRRTHHPRWRSGQHPYRHWRWEGTPDPRRLPSSLSTGGQKDCPATACVLSSQSGVTRDRHLGLDCAMEVSLQGALAPRGSGEREKTNISALRGHRGLRAGLSSPGHRPRRFGRFGRRIVARSDAS